jgi:Flp pilus assembly protein TadB
MINEAWGPYIVPVAVFAWLAIAGIVQMIGSVQKRRIQAEERMAMVQRGMTAEQIDLVLRPTKDDREEAAKTKDPLRSLGNARRTGVALVSAGCGLTLFGWLLSEIVQVREVLAVSAAGLIPLAIGIGFFVDYNLQKRELARFGLEVAADQPPQNRPS